jgi:hypothetical protein
MPGMLRTLSPRGRVRKRRDLDDTALCRSPFAQSNLMKKATFKGAGRVPAIIASKLNHSYRTKAAIDDPFVSGRSRDARWSSTSDGAGFAPFPMSGHSSPKLFGCAPKDGTVSPCATSWFIVGPTARPKAPRDGTFPTTGLLLMASGRCDDGIRLGQLTQLFPSPPLPVSACQRLGSSTANPAETVLVTD